VAVVAAPSISQFAGLVPADLELTVRDADTSTIVAGPTPVTLAAGGLYGILALDSVGGSTVDIVLFDDFD
jgi:hypothetical protein